MQSNPSCRLNPFWLKSGAVLAGLVGMSRSRPSLKRSRAEALAFIQNAVEAYVATNERAVTARKVIAANMGDLVVAACDVLDLTLAETGVQALERLAGHRVDTPDNPAHDWAMACRERIGDCEKWCNALSAENAELGEELALSELAQLGFVFDVSFASGSGGGLRVVPCEGSVFDAALHARLFALYMLFRTKGDMPCEGPYFMALATFFKDGGGLPWLNTQACKDLTGASLDLADELAGGSSKLDGTPGFQRWLLDLSRQDPTEATVSVVLERLRNPAGHSCKRIQLSQVVSDWCLAQDPKVAQRCGLALIRRGDLSCPEWEALGLHLCMGITLKSSALCDREPLIILFEMATRLRDGGRLALLALFVERFLCREGRVAILVGKLPAAQDLHALTTLAGELDAIQDADRWMEWELLPRLTAEALRRFLKLMGQEQTPPQPWARTILAVAKLNPLEKPELCLMLRMLMRTFGGNGTWCRKLMSAFLRSEAASVSAAYPDALVAAGMAYLATPTNSPGNVLQSLGVRPNDASLSAWIEGCRMRALWQVGYGSSESAAGELRWLLDQTIHFYNQIGTQGVAGPKTLRAMGQLRQYIQELRGTRPADDPIRRLLDTEGDGGLAEPTRRALLG